MGNRLFHFSDVVSGNEGINMMFLLGGGTNAVLCLPMMIFQDKSSSYPIRGLPGNVLGTFYRTETNVWMDRKVFC